MAMEALPKNTVLHRIAKEVLASVAVRMMTVAPWAALFLCSACLDPVEDNEVGLERVFGDPSVDPMSPPHVEDNDALASRVATFPDRTPYLFGYASGRRLRYWRVGGPVTDVIVPFYIVQERDGTRQRPIIDVLPGDTGYGPWWREVIIRTTEQYAGERIWSRAAIDAGQRLGLLEAPEPNTTVVTAPVVRRTVRVQVDETGRTVGTSWIWYRNQRVDWVRFESDIDVPEDVQRMPKAPVYIFQRINQAHRLYEFRVDVDLNDDGQLTESNNVFEADIGEPNYTPLWSPVLVRTVGDYDSFDGPAGPSAVELTNKAEFISATDGTVISDRIIGPPTPNTSVLDNCPIQRTPGSL